MKDEKVIVGKDFIATIPEDKQEPIVLTSYEDDMDKFSRDLLTNAINDPQLKDGIKMWSAEYPNEDMSSNSATPEAIDKLVSGIQNSLDNILTANNLVRKYIVSNDIIGKTYESIESNVNTNYTLSYKDVSSKRNKSKQLETAKAAIKTFNEQIDLRHLIRECIPLTYAEGTYIICLRYDGTSYVVNHYPLGVAYISDYTYGSKPVVCIDMTKLENALKKTYEKDKKRKAIFFNNIEEDIKNNYPSEVYQAYKNKESIARLDTVYTSVIRIGNLGRKYGVSPFIRALKSALMLENYENTDYINAKVRAKKILFQKMRKEVMSDEKGNYKKLGFEIQIKAHQDLMKAWSARTVMVYTGIPQVESLEWIVDKTDDTNSDKINIYRSKIMTTLGIGFADNSNANFSVANISLDQLMRTINSISEQLETAIRDWYRVLFTNEGIDMEYLPEIKIIDAEAMDMGVKKDLVELLYSKLNCSMETCLDVLGMSVDDERQKRVRENNEKYDTEIFKPHASQYTASNKSDSAGRPTDSDNTDKQQNDEEYNKQVRK